MNNHKAIFFPCPALRNHVLIVVRHVKSWRETFSGETQTYFIEPFLIKMHTKLARIKNLKNLNIGTDRPMQTV